FFLMFPYRPSASLGMSLPSVLYSLSFLLPCPHCFPFYGSPAHRDLHSFPTRRSSDLPDDVACRRDFGMWSEEPRIGGLVPGPDRSEEHTSELQSRFDLVCRLLLEKKKKHNRCPPTEKSH